MADVVEAGADAFLLGIADDALILGHRLSEWCGRAHSHEEDLALANIALDLIGQARVLYQRVGQATGRSEDELAYFRDAPAFRNAMLCELPNGDFAVTIARLLIYAAYADPWWRAAIRSTDTGLAELAAKAAKESVYHLRHSAEWLVRLGDGTAESARRAQAAVDALAPHAAALFEADAALVASGVAPDPETVRAAWRATLADVLARARLTWPEDAPPGPARGAHTPDLTALLAEMQELTRAHPGAVW